MKGTVNKILPFSLEGDSVGDSIYNVKNGQPSTFPQKYNLSHLGNLN